MLISSLRQEYLSHQTMASRHSDKSISGCMLYILLYGYNVSRTRNKKLLRMIIKDLSHVGLRAYPGRALNIFSYVNVKELVTGV